MDAEDRKLLIDIHGKVSAIQTTSDANASTLREIDIRQRRLEVGQAEHGVKILRLEADLDGMGRKVRAQQERRLAASAKPENEGSRWLAVLEILAAAPKWAHAIVSIGSAVMLAGMLLWRHWPR